jgi:two-component system phosphate regulon response regulator PhoB
MSRVQLLLVEDDAALTDLLQWHFEREDFDVRHTGDGEEAILLAAESPPDIVILDWMIEGVSGLEVCRRLRAATATAAVPIVMLTGRTEEPDRIRGLETGADDYVTKPFSPRELIARVRAVIRRSKPAPDQTLRLADLEMDIIRHKVKRAGRSVALGPTEFRLLRHLLEHPTQVFSRDRLLDAVWGREREIDPRTVDVHIRRLRQAINLEGRPELIRTVRSAGYAIDDEAA